MPENVRCFLRSLTALLHVVAEELGSQLAQFAFLETADFGDDLPSDAARSRDVRRPLYCPSL